jgi:hypothetical protein
VLEINSASNTISIKYNFYDFNEAEFIDTAINNPNVTDITLDHCPNLTNSNKLPVLEYLTELDISYSEINGECLVSLLRKAPRLKKIDAYHCKNLQGFNIDELPNLESLEKLEIPGSEITNAAFRSIIRKAPNLKIILVFSCDNLQNINIDDLPNLECLEELDVSSSHITGQELAIIMKKSKKLKILYARSCENLNDLHADELPTNLEYLEEFDVFYSNISGAVLAKIIKQHPKLHNKKDLLLNCLQKFSEYDPAIAFIASLIIQKHANNLSTNDLKNIFDSKCSYYKKLEIFAALNIAGRVADCSATPHLTPIVPY